MAPAARTKTLLAWSSGKDSAWTLHALRQDAAVEVVGLLTTVNQTFDRVAMHAVRTELLAAQAAAVGLPLDTVPIPYPCSNAEYEAAMGAAMERARRAGVQAVAFGDLFLEDVRRYREDRMRSTGLTPLFPIWGTPTGVLVARHGGGRTARPAHLRRSAEATRPLRGARLRRRAARGAGRAVPGDRSLRRAWRVPFLRVRRTDVHAPGRDSQRRGGGA